MKKFLYIITAGLLLSACAKDFLEKQPLDKMSEADIFSNAALATAYANSFYTILEDTFTEANVGSITDESWYNFGGSSTRIVASTFYTPDTFQYFNESDNGGLHNTRITHLNIWRSAYKGIRYINDFLVKMEESTIADADKKSLMGEAYFFRAWLYTNLIQRYGGVPIIKNVYGLTDEFNATRATFDECVDFILEDLKLAKENLLPYDKALKGRANVDIAMALEARLTLIAASAWFNDESDPTPSNPLTKGTYSKAKWTRALQANKAFLDECGGHYSLPAKYSDFWTNPSSTEIIWAKYYNNTSGDQAGRTAKAQYYYGPASMGGWRGCAPTEAMIIDYEMANGKKFFEEGSGYDPVHPWANRDPRFYDTILYPGCEFRGATYDTFNYFENRAATKTSANGNDYAADHTGYGLRKFHLEDQPISASVTTTTHYVWFRLAEMYLNYAECCYMTGDEGTARQYINMIRSRAGMPQVTESGANLFDRLVNERRIELAFECAFRYFDLRRWKLAEYYEQIPWMGVYAYAFQDKLNDPNATDDEKYDYRVARVYDGKTNTWPIAPTAQDKRVYKYTWLGKDYFVDFGDCHHQFGSTNKRFLKDRNYLLPIGTLEIEKSEGTIIQNPGYENACPANEENYSVYPTGFVSNPQLVGIQF